MRLVLAQGAVQASADAVDERSNKPGSGPSAGSSRSISSLAASNPPRSVIAQACAALQVATNTVVSK